MISMQCVKAVPYEGRQLNPGDRFEAKNDHDAHVLTVMGKAKKVRPEIPAIAKKAVVETTKKRTYRRRDMTAQ